MVWLPLMILAHRSALSRRRAGEPLVNLRSNDQALKIGRQLGEALGAVVGAPHRRRLAGIGWARALDPGSADWASVDRPNRQGNALDILIKGAEVFPQIAGELERDDPSDAFRLLVVLPAKPNSGGDDTRGVPGDRAGEPLTHRLVRLPSVSNRSKRCSVPCRGSSSLADWPTSACTGWRGCPTARGERCLEPRRSARSQPGLRVSRSSSRSQMPRKISLTK